MANAGNMTMLLHKVEALCALYADEDAVSEEWARRLAEIDRLLKAVRQEQRREQSAKTDQSARFEAWQARREEEGKLKQEMLDRRYQATMERAQREEAREAERLSQIKPPRVSSWPCVFRAPPGEVDTDAGQTD